MRAVNLIPTEQRPAAKGPAAVSAAPKAPGEGAFGAYLILGLLVFAIAATALYVLTNNTISEREAELAQVEAEAQAVEQQASSLQSFADFEQLADARMATVTGVAEARFPWSSTLDDVSRALPTDVYVSAVDGSTYSEASGSSLRGAISAPAIQLNGCTRDQVSVARLMSRLRDVRGVTRVSLAKSEAVDTPETAQAPAPATTSDGTVPTTISEPCPDGSPPAFELVMFFERAALSPNAAPNAGVSGVSAGPTGSTGTTTPASATATPAATTSTTSTTP